MGQESKKKRFEVQEGETIAECLERMEKLGYQPVRRMEKPIFIKQGNEYIPVRQQIIFEGFLTKGEQ